MPTCFKQFKAIRDLTAAEITQLRDHCYRGYVEIESHFLFHGKDGTDYGKITITFRGIQYHFRRHLLALFLKLHDADFDMATWTDGFEASHLCHKRRCYNPEHLVLEHRATNKSRDACVKDGSCRGHGEAPRCLI